MLGHRITLRRVLFLDDFLHVSNQKNMISTYTICETNDPNSSDCPPKERILKYLFSYLVCSQILLNLLVDDQQFGYITKLKRKSPDWDQDMSWINRRHLIVKHEYWYHFLFRFRYIQ